MNEIGIIQTMLPSMKKANIVWIREGKSKKYHTHTHTHLLNRHIINTVIVDKFTPTPSHKKKTTHTHTPTLPKKENQNNCHGRQVYPPPLKKKKNRKPQNSFPHIPIRH